MCYEHTTALNLFFFFNCQITKYFISSFISPGCRLHFSTKSDTLKWTVAYSKDRVARLWQSIEKGTLLSRAGKWRHTLCYITFSIVLFLSHFGQKWRHSLRLVFPMCFDYATECCAVRRKINCSVFIRPDTPYLGSYDEMSTTTSRWKKRGGSEIGIRTHKS